MNINNDLLSIIFSYITNEHIFSALVCKEWKNIIKDKYKQINTSYNAIDNIEKLLYFSIARYGYYPCRLEDGDDDLEIDGKLLSSIILHNLKKNNNYFLLYFDRKKVEMYDDKCLTMDGYILDFPQIIVHLLEEEKIELLQLICEEHCPDFYFPQSIIDIVCDISHEGEWDYNIIEKAIWKCLIKYGYKAFDLPEDHYAIRNMRSYANCSVCFGLDETCCW